MRELLEKANKSIIALRDGLNSICPDSEIYFPLNDVINEIQAELAKPEPEPVGYGIFTIDGILVGFSSSQNYALCNDKQLMKAIYTTCPEQSARIAELEEKLKLANNEIRIIEKHLIHSQQERFLLKEALDKARVKK